MAMQFWYTDRCKIRCTGDSHRCFANDQYYNVLMDPKYFYVNNQDHTYYHQHGYPTNRPELLCNQKIQSILHNTLQKPNNIYTKLGENFPNQLSFYFLVDGGKEDYFRECQLIMAIHRLIPIFLTKPMRVYLCMHEFKYFSEYNIKKNNKIIGKIYTFHCFNYPQCDIRLIYNTITNAFYYNALHINNHKTECYIDCKQ
eukprot:508893_1